MTLKKARPKILGALRDAASHGLANADSLHPKALPRMADFTLWAMTSEPAWTKPGSFDAAFAANAKRKDVTLVESNSPVMAIIALMDQCHSWKGPGTELMRSLLEASTIDT